MEDSRNVDITDESIIVFPQQKGIFQKLMKAGEELSKKLFLLKMAYCITDFVFEIMFFIQLTNDGHKGWAKAQLSIAIINPLAMFLASGLIFCYIYLSFAFDNEDTPVAIWTYLLLIFSPLVIIVYYPLAGIIGFYHFLEWWIERHIKKHPEKPLDGILSHWIFMLSTSVYASVISQYVGIIFKLYLVMNGYSKGFYSLSLIIMSSVYIMFTNLSMIKKAIEFSKIKFSKFEII
jgi:hypothetical protein